MPLLPQRSAVPRALAAGAAVAAVAGCGGGGVHAHRTLQVPPAQATPRPVARTRPTAPGRRAQEAAAIRRFVSLGRPVYCGGRTKPLVALTFDDGPGPYTGLALKELRRYGARATFFVVAKSIDQFPRWPRRERSLAAIGEHTMTHPYLPGLPPGRAETEIAGGRAAASRAAGTPVRLFRPPYGARDARIDADVRGNGMVEVLWDVDSADSRISPPADYLEISRNVRRNTRPGSIVLMHENRGQTIRALRTILPALRRRGLRLVTVPELLAQDPPTPQQLAAGPAGCGVGIQPGSGG